MINYQIYKEDIMSIEKIDFNELYIKEKNKTSFKAKDSISWNKKAQGMNKNVHKSIYNKELLDLINLDGINSLLDIGCGVGNISLILAKKLKNVYSLDFSSSMLEILESNAKLENINNIKTINLSWYDSWQKVPKADLVIASRCLEVKDMKQALEKLNNHARKKVVLSYKVGGSFISNDILKAINKTINKKPDYIYILNILYNMGINASLNFVRSEGRNTQYTSYEDFEKSIIWSLGKLEKNEIILLKEYYNKKITKLDISNDYVKWAVISWNK